MEEYILVKCGDRIFAALHGSCWVLKAAPVEHLEDVFDPQGNWLPWASWILEIAIEHHPAARVTTWAQWVEENRKNIVWQMSPPVTHYLWIGRNIPSLPDPRADEIIAQMVARGLIDVPPDATVAFFPADDREDMVWKTDVRGISYEIPLTLH